MNSTNGTTAGEVKNNMLEITYGMVQVCWLCACEPGFSPGLGGLEVYGETHD